MKELQRNDGALKTKAGIKKIILTPYPTHPHQAIFQ
jgi:hypothetical protein